MCLKEHDLKRNIRGTFAHLLFCAVQLGTLLSLSASKRSSPFTEPSFHEMMSCFGESTCDFSFTDVRNPFDHVHFSVSRSLLSTARTHAVLYAHIVHRCTSSADHRVCCVLPLQFTPLEAGLHLLHKTRFHIRQVRAQALRGPSARAQFTICIGALQTW